MVNLLLARMNMPLTPPMTSRQWLARVGGVVALGASEVTAAALTGIGGLQLAIVGVATVMFAGAYVVGKPTFERTALRPLITMGVATVIAVAMTGGLASPVLPIFAVPVILGWTVERPDVAAHACIAASAAIALLVGEIASTHLTAPSYSTHDLVGFGWWSTALAIWMIERRVSLLVETVHRQRGCLARVREAALTDAAGHRRGLESMSTKLAHELKNPLSAIKSLVQVEHRDAKDEKSARRLDVALAEIDRVGTILREYLEYTRPTQEVRIAPVHLDELMSDLSGLLGGRAETAGVELVVEGRGGALQADRFLLKDALVNLTANAIEATPHGGSVSVTCDVGDTGARIMIRDSGRGMSREVAMRVGTPFFTTRDGGTGLGVVIARTAISQHKGKLEYSSTPGLGTIATIALPLDPRTTQRFTT